MTTPAGAPGFALPGASDTIAAAATAPGRGALAIVRVSGPRAHEIGRALAKHWPRARRAALTALHDVDGRELDRAILVRYDAPASFTGEDAFEITTHGGLVVPATVLGAILARGARLATPGEFTRRAVLHGKLDVLQAEASADLVDAASRSAQRTALAQLDGGLSRRVLALRGDVLAIEALIGYEIDFPEEDDGPVAPARIEAALGRLMAALEALLATARTGELVRVGALVVLAGVPNAGKSSLFNALLGRNRAIVTEVPGTTRDALEAVLDAEPWPLRLVDTAGLRATTDRVERLGIEVSEDYLRRADVALVCGEDVESLGAAAAAVREATASGGGGGVPPLVLVRTKADRAAARPASPPALAALAARYGAPVVETSAESGTGLGALLDATERALGEGPAMGDADAPVLTQLRHRTAVTRALDEVVAFRRAWRDERLPAVIAAVHLRAAAGALEELVGRIDVEDVLSEIFRRFCVGK